MKETKTEDWGIKLHKEMKDAGYGDDYDLEKVIKSFISKLLKEEYERGYTNGSIAISDKIAKETDDLIRESERNRIIGILKKLEQNLPKVITPTVEPPPNRLSQNQIFAGGQANMLLRVMEVFTEAIKEIKRSD